MIRYLELQPPGARRHTCTAGTTETSLHGLLDVVIHTEATVREKIADVKLIYSGTKSGFTEIPELTARINDKGGNPMRVCCISSLKFMSQVEQKVKTATIFLLRQEITGVPADGPASDRIYSHGRRHETKWLLQFLADTRTHSRGM